MNVYDDKLDCYGCSACKNVCPKYAINMVKGEEGFQYPIIDDKLCINCNLCRKVCPINKSIIISTATKRAEQKIYAAKHQKLQVVLSSSSGGIFTALSDFILDKKGVVYGAAYDTGFRIVHKRITDNDNCDELRGSKYVQSDMSSIYRKIKADLNNGLYVLFSGTPCQNAALISYLGITNTKMDLLFTCDFVCHGTSSPKIWDDYISFIQDKFNDKIISFSFRSKKKGWRNFNIDIKLSNNVVSEKFYKKYSILKLYNSRLITRPSCYRCRYTSFERVSDITLADYWNIEHAIPEFNDNHGVSLVMVNSNKGFDLFNNISKTIHFVESNKNDAWQPHLEYPVKCPKLRNKFWDEYHSKGFSFIMKKYGQGTFSSLMIKRLTPIIKKVGLYAFAGKMYNKILKRD